jgi:hypothetical protein
MGFVEPGVHYSGEEREGLNRRILPVPARSGGGRLTERTLAIQPWPPEWVKVPLSGPCSDAAYPSARR